MITYRKRRARRKVEPPDDASDSAPERRPSALEFRSASTPRASSAPRGTNGRRPRSDAETAKMRSSRDSKYPIDGLGGTPRASSAPRGTNGRRPRSDTETAKMRSSRDDDFSRCSSSRDDLRYSSSRDGLRHSIDSLGSLAYSLDSFDLGVLGEEEEEREGGRHDECRGYIDDFDLGILEEEEHEEGERDNIRGSSRTVKSSGHCGKKNHQKGEQQLKPQENTSPGVDGSVGDVAEKEEVVESPKPNSVGHSPNEDDLEELEQTEKDDENKEEEARDRNRSESPCTSLRKALDHYLGSLDTAVEKIVAWERRKSEMRREMDELQMKREMDELPCRGR